MQAALPKIDTEEVDLTETTSRRDRITSHHKLRIVHVVSSLSVGGLEHFAVRLANAQQDNGHHVTILGMQGGPLEREARETGLKVMVLGGRLKALRAAKGALSLGILRPDIVHAHNQTSLHYAALAKHVSRARVVMTNHGQAWSSLRKPTNREWNKTDAIVTVSLAVRDRMDLTVVGDKISTIHNGVQFTAPKVDREQVRASLGIPLDHQVGIIVARVDALKGHETLLRALVKIRDGNTQLLILVAGDGFEFGRIVQLARELNLGADRLRFLGFRNDVPDLLGASDFFVLPSLSEGLPLSILEAMCHGLPTVATPVGGIPELIDHGVHGLLVPVKDPEALSEAMRSLAIDAPLCNRLGSAALNRSRDEFSFEEMTNEYDRLYYRVCGLSSG